MYTFCQKYFEKQNEYMKYSSKTRFLYLITGQTDGSIKLLILLY